ncbi:ABC transporter substrate-binding protein [Oscillospiraceae bacterium MB08-C2-2]|nr:ABC transporter substrate-binding protein [Oscillospiraceae bacterium MB08-C2-2]
MQTSKTATAKRVLTALLALMLVFSLSACQGNNVSSAGGSSQAASGSTPAGDSQDPIKVAAFFSLSGANADAGMRDKEGTDLAVEYINNNGGIKSMGGRKLEIVYGDMMSDVSQAKAVTERVLADKKIVAAVGVGGSAYAVPQLPIMEKNEIPYILMGTAASLTEEGFEYLFRVTAYGGATGSFGQMQVQFLQWLNEQYGANTSKVAIVYENSDFGISIADSNRTMIEAANMEVVYEESYPVGMTDASALVANMKNSGAEAVLIASFPQETKMIINAMKSINYSPVIIGGGAGFNFPETAAAMGDDVIGLTSVTMSNWDTLSVQDNPELKKIPEAYREKYGVFMCEHAISAYANIMILADALERAATTEGPALRDAIRATDIPTTQARGNVKFDEVGNNVNAVPVIVQWQKLEDGTLATCTVFPREDASREYLYIEN